VVASARKLIGATNPLNAEPGTIRGDLAVQTGRNVVHGSDSPENGERETGKHCCRDIPDDMALDSEFLLQNSAWHLALLAVPKSKMM
jgi:hypothetical protein